MISITTYDRPDMLLRLLKELQGVEDEILVVDDGSDYDATEYYDYCTYRRFAHQGKEGFWRIWNYILAMCERSKDDFFLFMPDDWHDVDLEKIRYIYNQFDESFACNITNNGIETNWTRCNPKEEMIGDIKAVLCGYVDCGFVTNRQALEMLDWHVRAPSYTRFKTPNISSGVGQDISTRLYRHGVKMYYPKTSLAWHDGTHESKMHPDERKKNPLIPK